MTEFVDELEAQDRRFELEWKEKNSIPEVLYHYTDAKGLIGIIEGKNIRLTHFNYVNDSSELRHGWKITTELFQNKIKQYSNNEPLKEFLEFMINSGHPLEDTCEVFLASLCEKGDLLNQWRGYGSSDGAFSIGIKTKNSWILQNLSQVEYSEDEQRRYINSIIDTWIDLLSKCSVPFYDNENFPKILAFFIRQLNRALIFFKNDAFKTELEWRICTQVFKKNAHRLFKKYKFREANGVIVPYLEISLLNDDSDNRIPIDSITFALAKDCNLTRKSIELLLLKHGYNLEEIKIIQSKVPLRFK